MEFYNLIFQAWKVVEFEYGSWKMTKSDFFDNNKAKHTSNELSFSHYLENNFSILGNGKHQRSRRKGHGKSWNFIR